MGGADVPGPCRYTNGEIRISNGFGGSPGSIVHLDKNGKFADELVSCRHRNEFTLSNETAHPIDRVERFRRISVEATGEVPFREQSWSSKIDFCS